MPHTVDIVCKATGFDRSVTVPEDALFRNLLAYAGLKDTMDILTHSPMYYRCTQPVSASILQPMTSIPEGETLFIRECE
jgi:hypothetical protein